MRRIGDVPGVAVAFPVGWSAYERFPFQLVTVRSPQSINLRMLMGKGQCPARSSLLKLRRAEGCPREERFFCFSLSTKSCIVRSRDPPQNFYLQTCFVSDQFIQGFL